VFLVAVFAPVFGTTLRAIGRGFGSGIFGVAQAWPVPPDHPTASTRLVAKAVDRKAAARADKVTVFPDNFLGGLLDGLSTVPWRRITQRPPHHLYCIEYVDKMPNTAKFSICAP